MIPRKSTTLLFDLANQFKAVAVVGPRQSGKTTLTKAVFPDKPYVNLENPDDRNFALEDPRGFLAQYPQGAIIDEAQRATELFSYLQQILDESPENGKFILTGSNNFLLQESITQSLAGRIAYLYLLPFSLSELSQDMIPTLDQFLFKGSYPPLYDREIDVSTWFANYIRTYVERDVRQIKNVLDLNSFDRFIRLCAGRIGQLLNMSNLSVEVGVDSKTIAAWVGILESSFIIFRLPPNHRNFNKRLVKMSKLYFYDTGLANALLGIGNSEMIAYHPLRGALFENMVISEIKKSQLNIGIESRLSFWRNHKGNEVDLILESGNGYTPIEIKSGQTVKSEHFKGLEYWNKLRKDEGGIVIYGGDKRQLRSNGIHVVPWVGIPEIEGLYSNDQLR